MRWRRSAAETEISREAADPPVGAALERRNWRLASRPLLYGKGRRRKRPRRPDAVVPVPSGRRRHWPEDWFAALNETEDGEVDEDK